MAGIYIHIPFCASRCIYCNFYSTTLLDLRQRYVDAVCKEFSHRAGYLKEPVHTIYIGGGTPSQLSLEQLEQLFETTGSADEITLECNPDDVTDEFAVGLSRLPVNRVSMGCQTFDEHRLRFLRRRHSAKQIPAAVERLRKAGICNISIDLIYGFPDETLADWKQDVEKALLLGVEHLSAYALSYEEGTPLYNMLKRCEIEEIDEEVSLQMFNYLIDSLMTAGYEHYEISNFSRPGYRSRHNSSYWHDIPYLGLGAGASSYDGESRQTNIENVVEYIQGIECKQLKLKFDREVLSESERYNDLILTSLRTIEGLPLSKLSAERLSYLRQQAQPYVKSGRLIEENGFLRLTRDGIFVSNGIMVDLML